MHIFSSFFDNLKQKTTNPFFGTLILVWAVRNWDLIYTLFNFDEDCDLADKKQFIRDYYSGKSLLIEFLSNVGLSLLFMIVGYSLIVITRVFVNWIDHKVIPELNLKFVSKLVVNSARYEESEKQRIDNYNLLISERENVNRLELKVSELKANINHLENDLTDTQSRLRITESDLHKVTNEHQESEKKNKNLITQNETLEKKHNILDKKLKWIDNLTIAKERLYIGNKISPFIFDLYVRLEEKDSAIVAFYMLAENIKKGIDLESEFNPVFTNFFLDNYMIYSKILPDENEFGKTKNFILTEYGEELVKYRKELSNEYNDAKSRVLPKATIIQY